MFWMGGNAATLSRGLKKRRRVEPLANGCFFAHRASRKCSVRVSHASRGRRTSGRQSAKARLEPLVLDGLQIETKKYSRADIRILSDNVGVFKSALQSRPRNGRRLARSAGLSVWRSILHRRAFAAGAPSRSDRGLVIDRSRRRRSEKPNRVSRSCGRLRAAGPNCHYAAGTAHPSGYRRYLADAL